MSHRQAKRKRQKQREVARYVTKQVAEMDTQFKALRARGMVIAQPSDLIAKP